MSDINVGIDEHRLVFVFGHGLQRVGAEGTPGGATGPHGADDLTNEKVLFDKLVGGLEADEPPAASAIDTYTATRSVPGGTLSSSRPSGGFSWFARPAPASVMTRPRPASFSCFFERSISSKPPATELKDFPALKSVTDV